MSPGSACLCGQAPSCWLPWLTRFFLRRGRGRGPSPGPYKREPSSLSLGPKGGWGGVAFQEEPLTPTSTFPRLSVPLPVSP